MRTESWSFEPPAWQARQRACTPPASTSTERRSRLPPHATTNRINQAFIEKNSFRALGTNRTVLQLRVESPPRIGEDQDRLTHAFSELLFQRLEFAVFLDPNLSVHAEV